MFVLVLLLVLEFGSNVSVLVFGELFDWVCSLVLFSGSCVSCCGVFCFWLLWLVGLDWLCFIWWWGGIWVFGCCYREWSLLFFFVWFWLCCVCWCSFGGILCGLFLVLLLLCWLLLSCLVWFWGGVDVGLILGLFVCNCLNWWSWWLFLCLLNFMISCLWVKFVVGMCYGLWVLWFLFFLCWFWFSLIWVWWWWLWWVGLWLFFWWGCWCVCL